MNLRSTFCRTAGFLGLALLSLSLAAGQPPLPEPLTLAGALAQADAPHPDLQSARARIEQAEAYGLEVASRTDAQLLLEARLEAVEPSHRALDSSNDDSSLKLKLRKRLYDFGHSEALGAAAEADRRGREWAFLDARQQRRLRILSDYFDVLLADLRYLRDSEEMTMAFLRWDKLKKIGEMGQASDIDVLEKESLFQQARQRLRLTENQQRASRSRLAISLNRPGELSSSLEKPVLKALQREAGDLNALTEKALADNPGLKRLRAQVAAAEQQLKGAEASGGPVIHGEIEAAAYSKVTGSRDPLSAALVLEMPLFSGGVVEARVARQHALLNERRAELAQAELKVRQAVLDLWLELDALRLKREEVKALGVYRELYLDRSRAYYELEVKSDLGDAEMRIVDYQLQKAQAEYAITLAWARLDALTGQLIAPDDRAPGEIR
jgi:outer membrane protein TolC